MLGSAGSYNDTYYIHSNHCLAKRSTESLKKMALVEEELPGVSKVRQDFQVREDNVLAHQLQDEEFEEHFSSNVQLRRTARQDVGVAIDLQKEEVLSYRQVELERRKQLQRREEEDQKHALEVERKIKEEEDIQAALKMQDELMAAKMQEQEKKKILQRQRQEALDARLARQASLKEEDESKQKRQREQEMSEREIRRLQELGQQPQRTKYPTRDQASTREPRLASPGSPARSLAREQPPRSPPTSKYPSHSRPPPPPQQELRHGPPTTSPPPSYDQFASAAPRGAVQEPPEKQFQGFELPPVMDENERIELQEQEDARVAQQLQQQEEKRRAEQQRRREQEDMEVAKRIQQEEMEAKRRRQQQQQQQQAQTPITDPEEEMQRREREDIELAKRLQQEEVEAHRQRKQQLELKKQQREQARSMRQHSMEERSPTSPGAQYSPTHSAPPTLLAAHRKGQPPPEGHPFNPTPVAQYRPGMTGIQVPRASTLQADNPQGKPSSKRGDTKKGKRK